MTRDRAAHLSEEEIVGFVLEDLPPESARAVDAHIDDCATCARLLESYFEATEFPEEAWASRRADAEARLRQRLQDVLVLEHNAEFESARIGVAADAAEVVNVPSLPARQAESATTDTGRRRFGSMPRWALAMAAGLVLAAGALGAWTASRVVSSRFDRSLARAEALRESERQAAAQQLAARDDRIAQFERALALSKPAGAPITIDGIRRSGAATVVRVPATSTEPVRLAFAATSTRSHAAYRVALFAYDRQARMREIWVADVPRADTPDGRAWAIVSVPAAALTPGEYLVQMSGRWPDEDQAQEFALHVQRP